LHLAVDIGNTEIAMGLHDGTAWISRWRIQTDSRRTADEYRILVAALLPTDAADWMRAVTLSSVVPELTGVLQSVSQALFAQTPLIVNVGVRTGMEVRYDPPRALGSDRLANAVAARALFGSPVIAVDFGTATTFSVVDEAGAFAGGAIAPGVGVAAAALAESGARLRRIDLTAAPMSVVGRTTESSMRSGILYGYAGLVDGLLTRMEAELSARPAVVATGGHAAALAPLVTRFDAVEPDLTLDGLRRIGELNW
jgi:type III pantothenate kinase